MRAFEQFQSKSISEMNVIRWRFDVSNGTEWSKKSINSLRLIALANATAN